MVIRLKDLKGFKGVDLQGRQKRGRFPVVEKSRRTMGGIVFDSAAEMRRYATLQLSERCGLITDLERQVAYPVFINGKLYCTFTADHRYKEDGELVVEEVKTSGTVKDASYRLRKKAAELMYGFKVRVVVAK